MSGHEEPCVTEETHFGAETTLLVSDDAATLNLAVWADLGVAR